jgi:hypothetical protein
MSNMFIIRDCWEGCKWEIVIALVFFPCCILFVLLFPYSSWLEGAYMGEL